ncbi:hypothetical protein QJ856_gp0585 [Tupanvirus deep ocean]|uniref:Uncharacterized protein n=2 Tax=Tupanvirus TaxID=2094720 RepID=A0AC62A8Q5_9VIRU|nr:hypothetical protein QJ856_gp0585 [Tupanvirus deep ocean]QKU34161.1 hypothetical protein [Tupanvirus deep ocean]
MNFNQANKTKSNNNLKSVINYAAEMLPSANKNHPNPIETLSPEDITYLQSYLEQLKTKKLKERATHNNPDYNEPRNGFGPGSGINQKISMRPGFLDNVTRNRANDIYDPLDREVPVDWRTYDTPVLPRLSNTFYTEPGSRGAASTRAGKRSQQVLGLNKVNDYYNPYEYGAKQNSLQPQYKPTYNGPYNVDPVVLNQMGIPNATQQQNYPSHIRNVNIESSLLQREMTHIPGQREITEKELNRFEALPFDPQDHRHIVWADNMPRGGYPTRTDRLEL